MKRLTMEYGDKRVSLLSCPFCGSDPVVHSYRRHGLRYSVRCGNEFGHCRMNPRTLDYLELDRAADDWNMRPQEPNDPLTLEELREMDGEPVWVIPPADSGWEPCWMLVIAEFNIVAKDVSISRSMYCSFDGCGTDWLAYRRKPEEGEC